MTNAGEKSLNEFIEDMYISGNKRVNFVRIIRQNNTLNITKNDFEKLKISSNINRYYHEYNHAQMMDAYEPFWEIIGDIINKNSLDVEKVFEKANVYSLHRSIFQSYFTLKECVREDEPILTEIDYEHERFIDGILMLLKILSEDYPIFIMLNKVNLITTSSLTILQKLLEMDCPNIKILGIVNRLGNISLYTHETYAEFILVCEEKDRISEWTLEEIEEVKKDKSFSLCLSDSKDYFMKIKNMFYCFAFEQAFNYLNFIHQRIELDKLKVSVDFQIQTLIYYIQACIYKKNNSMALLLCDNLKQINGGVLERYKNYNYYYLIAVANMCNGNQSDAREYVVKCRQFIDDDRSEFKVELLMNMIEFGGWNDICIIEKEVEVSQRLLKRCNTYKFQNHLAHIYVYCYGNENSLFVVPEGIEERIPMVMKGIKIAEKLGNNQFLMEAYRKNVMMASYNGFQNTSNYFYGKIIQVAKRVHDRMIEAHIYNGLGYNCSAVDNYVEANDYYNKSLEIYIEEKSTDYILETLYNMGMNNILSGDYGNAIDYLVTILNLMNMLKKNDLRVCHVSKIYGLIALASYKMEKFNATHFYLNKQKQFLEYILDYDKRDESDNYLWDDDLFLYYYVTALQEQHKENYNEALENYDKAYAYMERSVGSMYFNYSLYTWDKANLYKIMNMNEDRQLLLREARTFFGRKGNFYRIRMIDELIYKGEWQLFVIEMPLRNVNLKDIIKLAKWEKIQDEAKAKKMDIRFFTTLQELINHSYKNVKEQTETLIFNFKNNYNVDNVIYISFEEDNYNLKYSDLTYEISEDKIQSLKQYFTNNTEGFAVSKFSNNYTDYKPILELFSRSKIFSVIAVPLYNNDKLISVFIAFDCIRNSWNSTVRTKTMDRNDLDIYRFVFRQVVDANEKFKLNEQLKIQAITDELTGLYNRKGYYKKIDELMKKSIETKKQMNATIIYADLDHFKYYNDTFGHHVGDAILVEFAKIFKNLCGNNGLPVRFGGDEFVIFLKTVNREVVQKVIDDIYIAIEKQDGFQKTVEKYMNGKIHIPNESKVTCSIGIAFQENISNYEEYLELIKQADEALYMVKNKGKGYALWNGNNYISKA